MKVEYEGVIPLVSRAAGWQGFNTDFSFNPAPSIPEYLQPIFEQASQITQERRPNDTNGDKAAVRRLVASDKILVVEADLTKYFILWGLPHASPQLHLQALKDLGETQTTEIPMGISTHNILMTTYRDIQPKNVAMVVRSSTVGFSAGRLSISFEEQMDPDKDSTPFNTAYRGFREEFNVYVPHQSIRLLAVCAEKGSAYTSWCHLGMVNMDDDAVVKAYTEAKDIGESSALLIAPVEEIKSFAEAEIKPETWRPYLKAGSVDEAAILKPHPTVPWRVDALNDFLQVAQWGSYP